MGIPRLLLFCGFALAALGNAAPAYSASEDLARQAYAILKKNCYSCHGETFNGSADLNVMDRDGLIGEDNSYITPENPDESYALQRIVDGDMPPEESPPVSLSDIATLKKWIAAGAPFPTRSQRAFKSEKDILSDILAFLRTVDEADRQYIRFFTLTHLHNNDQVTDLEMRLHRAAFSKAANSLSWEPDIVTPTAVDEQQSVFAVDLRDLGWDRRRLWAVILRHYPYGLKHNNDDDRELRALANELMRVTGADLSYIRADWFVATATRPPLYHLMLDIPETDKQLEQLLRVNVEDDFLRDKLARAGFAQSGVSSQNRLVDRHRAAHGAYWKSYDFLDATGRGNLFRFPLGPNFESNPFDRHAFQHDGGEQIFNLPNGLQGYMLIDGQGNRINEGPIKVVQDSLKTSGSPVIVNGLSCMACHKHGMIKFEDTVRDSIAVGGEAERKVEQLYVPRARIDELLQKDQDRFLAALEQATADFLQTGDDEEKDLRQFAEPIGGIARLYHKDVTLEVAAWELGLEDPQRLKTAIQLNPTLHQLGLAPLANGQTIKRTVWESRKAVVSPAQRTARLLGMGTPLIMLQ